MSVAPTLVYEFANGNIKPFLEAGIGIAVFSGGSADDQKFGSVFNFKDRIGAGVKIGVTKRVGIRAIHYSNAAVIWRLLGSKARLAAVLRVRAQR